MKNAKDILRQKEAELARVRHEVESLRIVAGLLADGDSSVADISLAPDGPNGKALNREEEAVDSSTEASDPAAEATGTHGMFSSLSEQRPKRWNVLKRHS